MKIHDREIGDGHPCFIIAEIGNNHNGSKKLAIQLVDEAILAGVDAVKFQMRDMDSLYGKMAKGNKDQADLGAQYTLDLLEKFQLSNDDMFAVFDYCRSKGILAFCTPWDAKSVERLENYGLDLYKVASADLTNHPLLIQLAKTGKPIICSTGMATDQEISDASAILKAHAKSFALLHCNSTYPAPFKDINLRYMTKLKTFCPIVGYSGHERGIHVPIAAVAMGAAIIEKHFTLDKKMEGVDHKVSLLPSEMKLMVDQIRELELALGSSTLGPRKLSQGEMMNRENLGKSIVAAQEIAKGQILTEALLKIQSPGQGLPPYLLSKLIGTKAKRDFRAEEAFMRGDLESASVEGTPKAYKFKRPWGIPVRYHDTAAFLQRVTPDFVEFHLSYGDMDVDPKKFLSGPYPKLGFTVHAPELFAGDHLLDLCSTSSSYLKTSLDNMRRVVDITLALKELFPSVARPFIVATVGGFTEQRALTKEERRPLYGRILESLRMLEDPGVEILPQTAAPFPWHMGGQQYQNLFLFPDEIVEFCKQHNYRMCVDVSHSYLACNHYRISPEAFFEAVAPYTAHVHLGDSTGVDGEGLQIGEGEVDFKMLGRVFDAKAPKAWFIPEIWQGHKNGGEAFWVALNRLESFL